MERAIEIRKKSAFEKLAELERETLQYALNRTQDRGILTYSEINRLQEYLNNIQYFSTRINAFYDGIASSEETPEEEIRPFEENPTW